jgi:hypothetical protein
MSVMKKRHYLVKYSRATSRVSWLNGERNQRFEDHLRPRPQDTEVAGHCWELQPLQYPEYEDGDGPRNVGFFAIQPIDAAGSPRIFYYT